MEILKQPQYLPMNAEYQVIILYAVINQYLLDIPVNTVTKFTEELIKFVEGNFPHIILSIRETGDLTEETEESIILALKEFKKIFSFT